MLSALIFVRVFCLLFLVRSFVCLLLVFFFVLFLSCCVYLIFLFQAVEWFLQQTPALDAEEVQLEFHLFMVL